MHILHIVNSYGGTEVYKNLFTALDRLNVVQTIFVPLSNSNRSRVGNHLIDFTCKDSRIIYSTALRKRHKFLFSSKIQVIFQEICNNIDFNCIDCIHAHMLCVDGSVARLLSRKFKIPYVVSFRNTDLNTYYKFFWFYKKKFNKVAADSGKLVFISPRYQQIFFEKYFDKKLHIRNNSVVIPNGINDKFLLNINPLSKNLNSTIKLLFVGAFKEGKGLIESILALDLLRNKGIDVELSAIGKGLPNRGADSQYELKVEHMSKSRSWVNLYNFMDIDSLIQAMRSYDIFIMPSQPETFGLVYVEALSQKLPLIYSKGEGFDGYFPEGYVGYSVSPKCIDDISLKIELLIHNYSKIQKNIQDLDIVGAFSWKKVAIKYKQIYEHIL